MATVRAASAALRFGCVFHGILGSDSTGGGQPFHGIVEGFHAIVGTLI